MIIVFMFLAGANFALQYRALAQRSFKIVFRDEELRAYAAVTAMATLALMVILWGTMSAGNNLRTSLFQVLSILATTGYASVDFELWNQQAKAVLLLGADILTGMSATAATLGNVGPGFGAVGPMGHFGDLHPISRIVLTLAMWIGRLEVLTVLVILRPEAWRSGRWSSADGATA